MHGLPYGHGPFVFEHAAVRVEGCAICHTPHGAYRASCWRGARPVPLSAVSWGPARRTGQRATPAGFQTRGDCTRCHAAIHGSNFSGCFSSRGGGYKWRASVALTALCRFGGICVMRSRRDRCASRSNGREGSRCPRIVRCRLSFPEPRRLPRHLQAVVRPDCGSQLQGVDLYGDADEGASAFADRFFVTASGLGGDVSDALKSASQRRVYKLRQLAAQPLVRLRPTDA